MKKRGGQIVRVLRRSTALALALAALWVMVRTADLTGAVQALAPDAGLTRSLLEGALPFGRDQPEGWRGLLLGRSPLLASLPRLDPPPAPAEPEPEPAPPALDVPKPAPAPADPLPDDEDTGVVAQTLKPSPYQTYLQTGEVYIANRAQKDVDVAALAAAEVQLPLSDGPQILILHSHATEAYTQSGRDRYEESDPYRTLDCNYNVVRVGEEIAQVFREHGLSVIHDTNLYDYPSYNAAYTRSLEAVEQWLRQYPSIQVILDVHRDALAAEDGTIYKVVSREGGEQVAQVMLVVGSDGGSAYHPLWQENLSFAIHLQQQLLDDYDTLARPIVLRSSRFNQQLRTGSLLIEIGTHGNTLAEAVAGARLFAESAVKVLQSS